MTNKNKVYITDGFVSLCEYIPKEDDIGGYNCWLDGETQRGYNHIYKGSFEDFTAEEIKSRFIAVVVRCCDGARIGQIFLSAENEPGNNTAPADLAIMIYPDYRNAGAGFAAFFLGVRYCFDFLKLDCISAGCYEDNTASLKIIKKCGFFRHPPGDVIEKHYLTGNPVIQLDFIIYNDNLIKSEPEWIFIDMGGTIIDETDQETDAIEQICSLFLLEGLMYTQSEVYSAMIEASKNYITPKNGAIKSLAVSEEQAARITSQTTYLPQKAKLYHGVQKVLEYLSKKYKLGIIANQRTTARDILKNENIYDFFSVLIISAEIGINKPDRRIFIHALREAGCVPSKAVYIGDRLDNDIYPAKSSGMKTIWVKQGIAAYQKPLNDEYKADIETDTLCSLFGIL